MRGVQHVRFINLKCEGCFAENPDDDIFKLKEFLKKDEAEEKKEEEEKSEEQKIFDVQKVKKSWVYKIEQITILESKMDAKQVAHLAKALSLS